MKYIIILVLLSLYSCELLTNDCDNFTSCSPSWCEKVSNTACVDPRASDVVDTKFATDFLSKMGCKQCTQSTNERCSNAYLGANLRTAGGLMAVYCNDDYLVLHGNGAPSHTDGLADIPRPPGEGGVQYANACVTRNWHQAYQINKIPLNPVKLSTSTVSNNVSAFVGQTDPLALTGMGLPESGPISISVSGQNMFPIYNNGGIMVNEACESDKCTAHAGQGFDYHYHGDPFSNIAGRCLYSPADYDSTGHPPLIAFSLDGYNVYGRHLKTTDLGQTVALDDCGGHDHGTYGYHYHSQVIDVAATSKTKQFYAYIGGPYKCWKGDISKTYFFNNSQPPEKRADYEYLKPCCSTTNFYLKSGVTLPSATGTGAVATNGVGTTTGTTSGTTTGTTTGTTVGSTSNSSFLGLTFMFYMILITISLL